MRVVASCICGSDLWPYRGAHQIPAPRRIGHEFVGVVEEVGADVEGPRVGQFVVVPFGIYDNTCVNCRRGVHSSCVQGSYWGGLDADGLPIDGAQGEWVRVPLAAGTLVALDDLPSAEQTPHLLALTDVMATGHHAAVSARVAPGDGVVVVGDGAVGLCTVLAARRRGAERIVLMSRNETSSALGIDFGADTVISERGADGVAAVIDLFNGLGADAVLECVGTAESMDQAVASVRPGGRIGFVGLPDGGRSVRLQPLFRRNVAMAGGVAPVRGYLPELLVDVLDGSLRPGAVFDTTIPLVQVTDGYRAMDERTAIKVMMRS